MTSRRPLPALSTPRSRRAARSTLAALGATALLGTSLLGPAAWAGTPVTADPASTTDPASAAETSPSSAPADGDDTATTSDATPTTSGSGTTAPASPDTATPADAAVYNGSTADGGKPNTSPVVAGGLSRAMRYVVTGKDGKTYESNYGSKDGFNNGSPTGASIVDVDQMKDLSFVTTLTNTTDKDMTVTVTYYLPDGNRLTFYTGRDTSKNPAVAADGAPTVTGADGAPSTALSVTTRDVVKDGQTVAANAIADVKGTLAPGQSVTVTFPLRLTNADTLEMSDTAGYDASYASVREFYLVVNGTREEYVGAITSARFAHRILAQAGAGKGKDWLASGERYLGTTREERDGTAVGTRYTMVPEDIQKRMPVMDPAEVYAVNVPTGQGAQSFAGATTRFSARGDQDPVLYTGGTYDIDTTRIKEALAGTGWSVNNLQHPSYTAHNAAGDVDGISDVYAYQTWDGLDIDGVPDGEEDNPYVELYQYISTRDVTIWVGDPVDTRNATADADEPAPAVTSTPSGESTAVPSTAPATTPTADPTAAPAAAPSAPVDTAASAHHTLRFLRDYDANNVDGDPLTVNDTTVSVDDSAVNNQVPGRYPVYYTYTPGYGTPDPDSVTATAYVTVLKKVPLPKVTPTCEPGEHPTWPAQTDTDDVTWTLTEDGHLVATTTEYRRFEDGSTSVDLGTAADAATAADVVCPPLPTPTPTPSASASPEPTTQPTSAPSPSASSEPSPTATSTPTAPSSPSGPSTPAGGTTPPPSAPTNPAAASGQRAVAHHLARTGAAVAGLVLTAGLLTGAGILLVRRRQQ